MKLYYHLMVKFLWTTYIFLLIFLFKVDASAQENSGSSSKESEKNTTELNEVVVDSTPLQQSPLEVAQPITILEGKELEQKQGSTIGQTLQNEPGITASNFGAGASRPLIRGLGGDRIRILENGTGSQDVSSTSPDHAVSIDPALVKKIEVVRGPASLLYGTSAVGGVVNIIDNRIPTEIPERAIGGNLEIRGGTVDSEKTEALSVDGGSGNFVLHVDGLNRDTNNYQIPGFGRTRELRENGDALAYPEPKGRLTYSDTNTQSGSVGGSYIDEKTLAGISYNRFETIYGVPNGEDNISIDAHRDRYDGRVKFNDPVKTLKSIDLKGGYVNYAHTEFEGSDLGTTFASKGFDSRAEITHNKLEGFEGVIGGQLQKNDFSAIGAERFQPPTDTEVGSLFLFEEYLLTPDLKLQGGARLDNQDLSTNDYTGPGISEPTRFVRNFLTSSESLGVVWNPVLNYALALSIVRTERAPNGQELFANGPHVATGTFEIGNPNLTTEKSVGLDLTLKKEVGRVTGSIGGYFNRFDNFVNLSNNGGKEHGLQVALFKATNADFYGFENKLAYHFMDLKNRDLSMDIQTDYVRATDKETKSPLPRIPPLRLGTGLNYKLEESLLARIELQHIFQQGRTAVFETETPDYNLLNFYLTKGIKLNNFPLDIFLKGNNLLDEKVREHQSFIKDVAPQPGANVIAGLNIVF